jgi:hypothetical protein
MSDELKQRFIRARLKTILEHELGKRDATKLAPTSRSFRAWVI